MNKRALLTTGLLLLVLQNSPAQEGNIDDGWLTRSGYYRVSYTSKLNPIVINRIHDWVVHVSDANGKPVADAIIAVTGGMPLHNHGLPTRPQMTRSLGDGNYLLEGMRFHMSGDWELAIDVDAGGRRDTVVIPITI